jgi:hypothetical protein
MKQAIMLVATFGLLGSGGIRQDHGSRENQSFDY